MAGINEPNNSPETISEKSSNLSELLPTGIPSKHDITDFIQKNLIPDKHLKNNCEHGAKILPEGEGEKPIDSKPGEEIDIAMDAVACTTENGDIKPDTVIVVNGIPSNIDITDKKGENSSVKGLNLKEGFGRKTKPEDINWARKELQKKN